jgi:L-ascorbate metabolism protein UlaG (beta-lactamase superfamily)
MKLHFHGHATWRVDNETRVHIPMHYGTFPLIDVDPSEFVSRVKDAGRNAVIVAPGDSYEL